MRRHWLLALPGTALSVAVCLSPWRPDWQARFVQPLEFATRARLGRDPRLDPRLVIYAFGDSTINKLQRERLSLDEWTEIFRGLQAAKPRVVIVDKVFGMPDGIAHAAAFSRSVGKLDYPVVAGAFVTTVPVPGRPSLSLDRPELRVTGWARGNIADIDWLRERSGLVYGPHPEIAEAFRSVGNLVYEGYHRVPLLTRLGNDVLLPHVALYASSTRELTRDRLIVDGKPVPLAADGTALVNLGTPTSYYRNVRTVAALVDKIRHHTPLDLPENAVILLLPSMYTGGTDFAATPFGPVQGGLVIAALANSAITGKWLRELSHAWLVPVCFGALAFVVDMLTAAAVLDLVAVAITLTLVSAGLLSFAYLDLQLPWLFALLAFWGSLVPLRLRRTWQVHRERERLRDALTGHLAPGEVLAAVGGKRKVSLEPVGRVVTVMFIDIVGFSATIAEQSPGEAFHDLKERLGKLADEVHRHGGVVDKSTGDGLLCFFGYAYDGSSTHPDHAERALRCADDIQRSCLQHDREAVALGKPVFPLRIGINTAAVYLGNLGSERRAELTLIGHGVNVAKRLESACDGYRVLVGNATRDLLGVAARRRLITRAIQIKHEADLIDAYEYDPFLSTPEEHTEAKNLARVVLGKNRNEDRHPIPPEAEIMVHEARLGARLVNFSRGGLGILGDRYLACGVTLAIELRSPRGLERTLRAESLMPIVGEIRWGEAGGSKRAWMGVQIKNLSEEQRVRLCEILADDVSGKVRKKRARAA